MAKIWISNSKWPKSDFVTGNNLCVKQNTIFWLNKTNNSICDYKWPNFDFLTINDQDLSLWLEMSVIRLGNWEYPMP